ARAVAGQALPHGVDVALPRVGGGAARLPVHALGQPDAHPEGLEGAVLPDRGELLPHVEGLLGRRRLGLLGVAPGPALPELLHALGLRAVGGPQARREPARRVADAALESVLPCRGAARREQWRPTLAASSARADRTARCRRACRRAW